MQHESRRRVRRDGRDKRRAGTTLRRGGGAGRGRGFCGQRRRRRRMRRQDGRRGRAKLLASIRERRARMLLPPAATGVGVGFDRLEKCRRAGNGRQRRQHRREGRSGEAPAGAFRYLPQDVHGAAVITFERLEAACTFSINPASTRESRSFRLPGAGGATSVRPGRRVAWRRARACLPGRLRSTPTCCWRKRPGRAAPRGGPGAPRRRADRACGCSGARRA